MEKEDTTLPNNSFVLGSNGQFEVSGSDCFRFVKPASDEGPVKLQKIEAGVDVVTKIAWVDFWRGPAWLRKQWDLHCSKSGNGSASKEFIILLFFNPTSKCYFWHPPKQKGSAASLNYNTSEDDDILKLIGEGNMLVGTMHNHFGKGTAFQSGTDKHDEVKHGLPMIHFTMAWMDAPHLYCSEFHIRFVAGDYEKLMDLNHIVDTTNMIAPAGQEPPVEWDQKLTIEYTPTHVHMGGYSGAGGKSWNDYSDWNRGSLRGRRIKSLQGVADKSDEEYEAFYGGWSHVKSDEDKSIYQGREASLQGPEEEEEDALSLTKLMLSDGWESTSSGKEWLEKFNRVSNLLKGKNIINAMMALSKMEVDLYHLCNTETVGEGHDITPIEMLDPDAMLDVMGDLVECISSVRLLIHEFACSQQMALDKASEEVIVSD